jgi:hypothetical protein
VVFMARNYHRSPDRKEQKVGFTSLLPSGVLSSVGRGPLRHESRTTGRRLCVVRQVRQLERSVAASLQQLGLRPWDAAQPPAFAVTGFRRSSSRLASPLRS